MPRASRIASWIVVWALAVVVGGCAAPNTGDRPLPTPGRGQVASPDGPSALGATSMPENAVASLSGATVTAVGFDAARTPSPTAATTPEDANVLGGLVDAYCVRAHEREVLFTLRRRTEGRTKAVSDAIVYRAAIVGDSVVGPVTRELDLGARAERVDIAIDQLVCQNGEVVVAVGNGERMAGGGWWAEVWHAGPGVAGLALDDHGMAREIGPNRVAWSPDGRTLLLEASPLGHAGALYLLDLVTERATRIEGASTWVPAGAGSGWIRWGGEGRLAVAESLDVEPDGTLSRFVQVIDAGADPPRVVGDMRLARAIASGVARDGTFIYLAPDVVADDAAEMPFRVYRWHPADPHVDPVEIARCASPAIAGRDALWEPVIVPDVRPSADDTPDAAAPLRLLFRVREVGDRVALGLFSATIGDAGSCTVRRVTPEGVDVDAVEAEGGLVVYRVDAPGAEWGAVSSTPLDVGSQLRVVPEAELRR